MGGTSKNIVIDGDMMIVKRTGEVLNPEFNSAYSKEKFQADFIVITDHKIICRRAEGIHILNDIDTLGT